MRSLEVPEKQSPDSLCQLSQMAPAMSKFRANPNRQPMPRSTHIINGVRSAMSKALIVFCRTKQFARDWLRSVQQ